MCKVLSISIAAYNVEKYILKTLDSLVDPAILDKIEVLIEINGATDSTEAIVQPYIDKYPNTFKLIRRNENGGYGATINMSMDAATGKYFKLLDR